MHKVVNGFANESEELLPKKIVTVDADAAAGGDPVHRPWIVKPLQRVADGVQEIPIYAGRDTNMRSGGNDVGIAPKIRIRNRVMPCRCAVVAAKPVTPIVP